MLMGNTFAQNFHFVLYTLLSLLFCTRLIWNDMQIWNLIWTSNNVACNMLRDFHTRVCNLSICSSNQVWSWEYIASVPETLARLHASELKSYKLLLTLVHRLGCYWSTNECIMWHVRDFPPDVRKRRRAGILFFHPRRRERQDKQRAVWKALVRDFGL